MQLTPLAPLDRISTTTQAAPGRADDGFARVLSQVLGGASQSDAQANEAIAALASGEADDVHSAVLAVAQADLGFRLALEIRNRMLEAFQEVSRLQV